MDLTITHKYLRNLLDNLNDENYDDLLVELQFSTLIVPVSEYNGVPIVDNKYLPLFTDFHEFDRFNQDNEYMPIDHEFNYYLHLLKDRKVKGFVINPNSENYKFTREILKDLMPNHIFDQEYQVFTVNEIRQIKNSINNDDLNEYLKDSSNHWDLDTLVKKINRATLLTLLVSDVDYSPKAEGGVIPIMEIIPRCLYEKGGKMYLLLFSRKVTLDSIYDDVFKYSKIVNFPLLVEAVLNHDIDGFILNIDEENITIPRENLRNFMKDFKMPLLDDYSMYAFIIEDGDMNV